MSTTPPKLKPRATWYLVGAAVMLAGFVVAETPVELNMEPPFLDHHVEVFGAVREPHRHRLLCWPRDDVRCGHYRSASHQAAGAISETLRPGPWVPVRASIDGHGHRAVS